MLISDSEFEKRINNPLNLLNREKPKKDNAMSLFIRPTVSEVKEDKFKLTFTKDNNANENPIVTSTAIVPVPEIVPSIIEPIEEEPKVDDILKNVDGNLKLTLAHNKALDLIGKSMETLENKLPEIKADRLPNLVASLSKVVTDIRREQMERSKNEAVENVHFHFYCPEPKKLEQYEIIEVA